jgi:hypothetical protein
MAYRLWAAGAAGGLLLGSYAVIQAKFRPLHLVWDLDNT